MNIIPERFRRRTWLFLPPLLIGVAVVLAFAKSRKQLVRLPPPEKAVQLPVIRAQHSKLAPRAIGYGTARPARVWDAIAEVPGTIVATHPMLRSGNRVQQDELLVQIDPLDYRLRVTQRQADLDSARAGVDQLLASQAADQASLAIEEKLLRVTDQELQRLSQLRETSAASQSEADRAKGEWLRQTQSAQQLRNALSIYPSRIAAAKANVALSEARLEEARRDLARTEIVAPFSGILSGVELEPRQFVAQAANLFELHDTDTIEINAQFSPSQIIPLLRGRQTGAATAGYSSLIGAIQDGCLTATVTARSGSAEVRWPGKPVRVVEAIDPATRTLGIVIAVDNTIASALPLVAGRPREGAGAASDSEIRLFPGRYCEVTLAATEQQDSIAIPVTAATSGTVFIVNDQDRLEKREVTIAYRSGRQLVITDGIDLGDRVAIKPPLPAIEGMLVIPEFVSADGDGPVAVLTPAETRQ